MVVGQYIKRAARWVKGKLNARTAAQLGTYTALVADRAKQLVRSTARSPRNLAIGAAKAWKVYQRHRHRVTHRYTHRGNQDHPTTGVGRSYVKRIGKAKKAYSIGVKLDPPVTLDQVGPGGQSSALNVQSVGTILQLGSKADFTTRYIPNAQKYTSSASGTTTLETHRVIEQAHQRSFKILVSDLSAKLLLTNQGVDAIDIDIYYCVSKVTKETLTLPEDDWTSGIYDQGLDTVPANIHPYSNPKTSKLFNMNWKVYNKQRIELGPGRTHEYNIINKPKRVMDTEYFYKYAQLKGFTTCIMAVVHGLPVDDNNLSNVVGNVSIAPTKVIAVSNKHTVVRMGSYYPRIYLQESYLQTPSAGKAYTMSEFSNIASDVIGTFA